MTCPIGELLDDAASCCCGCQPLRRAAPRPAPRNPRGMQRLLHGMAPLLLWTATLTALASLGSAAAMPLLTEGSEARLGIPAVPPSVLEWYLQQRFERMAPEERDYDRMIQDADFAKQFRLWLDTQLARLQVPVVPAEPEEPTKVLAPVPPPPPKRGNYMALCHFKICNMGRKRSTRIQPQDLALS